jgi:dihydrofolate reductase
MYITTVDVMSANGRIAKDDDDKHAWTSEDDWDHFKTLAGQHNLLVMDLETYQMVQPEPEADRLRMIVTTQPKLQVDIPGQLEFVNYTPKTLVQKLTARGYKKMLLVGRQTNAAFLQAGLVNEVIITIEPIMFGGGKVLLEAPGLTVDLHLVSIEQLNTKGTLLARYSVDRPGKAR